MPYDIDVNEIMAGPQEMALAISRLDAQGWNTSGKTYSVTAQRAIMMLYSVREEILEISLRVKVESLKSRVQ
jgi:chromatin structure-remodeling complex subunit RSC3/30